MSRRGSRRARAAGWPAPRSRRKSPTARSVPAKASRKSSAPTPRCSAIAASCTPAGQPSVSSCRRSSSSPVSGTSCSAKKSAISSAPKRRSSLAQLEQVAAQSQPAERQRRIRPGAGDEPEPVGQRIDEGREHRRGGRRQVQVVDDDHARRVDGGQLVGHGDRRVVGVWRPSRSSSTKASSATPGHAPRSPTAGRT